MSNATRMADLADHTSSERWRQRLTKESAFMAQKTKTDFAKVGEKIYQKNTYLGLFTKSAEDTERREWSYDKTVAISEFCPKCERDSFTCKHKKQATSPKDIHVAPLTSAHAVGWRPAIDRPNMGHNRSSLVKDTFFNKCHLST
eukprot:GILK01002248.1.p1 GENE.GILK01002248.1~~GILK01002248.1.p1  ORF type:complete len:167 (-),score=11.06 GILK01002248.1:83-514(-)